MEDNFSTDGVGGGWFGDTFTATLFLLLLHQLHFISSGMRSGRLGTLALEE